MIEAVRPERHPAPGFPGLYAARVLDVASDDHVGRIRVVVPSVFDGDDAQSAVWARPCLPWGHFFVPEPGDEVWVAFESGDPSSPVWLGWWLPSGATPASADVSPPVKRVIRSKTHEVLMDDTSGSEKVVLKDKAGTRIELRTDGVLVHAAQALTIEAPGKALTISAQSIVLKAASVDVQSGP
jgi:uncharacterized protein involved in type VI secretion and phage assembly